MLNSLLSLLTKDAPLGAITGLCILAIVWLTKQLLSEKDKEIKQAKEGEEKVTLVLGEVDNTLQAILITLKDRSHDEKTEKS